VQRHPELRWFASIALIVAVGVLVSTSVSGVFREQSGLPVTGAQQLIDEVRSPYPGGYYGTVDTQVRLGLPHPLATALSGAAPAGNLLRGSHRLRYWYGGPVRQRVAVVNETSEQDMFRSGTDTWQWDTSTQVARRGTTSPTDQDAVLPLRLASAAALTPPQLAEHILDVVGDHSDAALRSGDQIAGRPTYQLVLSPDTPSSRIGEVDIDVDGREGVPLRVLMYSSAGGNPVLDVSFEDDLRFAAPSSQNFRFRPPSSAVVRSGPVPSSFASALDDTALIGENWLTIASYQSDLATGKNLARIVGTLLDGSARPVKGSWGRGRLLVTPILSVLVTRRGQVLAGPVTPNVLYSAVS
jgi:outer membrane lipoprotein-sorting protein